MRKIKKPLEAAAVAEAMRAALATVQAGGDVLATLRAHDERGQTDRLLQVLENVPAVNRLTGAEAEAITAATAELLGA